MKVVAFNGSVHETGNTHDLLQVVLKEIAAEGIDTELVQLAPLNIRPCQACFKCRQAKTMKCVSIRDDGLNDALEKMFAADAILIGSPVWFSNVTGHVKNLIDRAGTVTRSNGAPLTRKVGAAVAAVRRAGGLSTFDAINHFFHINGMIVPGSSYWNIGIGRVPGDCMNDVEGVQTMVDLGRNTAWLLKKLCAEK